MHRSVDHALAITRNEFNHVVLECRSAQNCQHSRIIGALGLTNDRIYAETPDQLISGLSRVPIRPSSFNSPTVRKIARRARRRRERRTGSPGVCGPPTKKRTWTRSPRRWARIDAIHGLSLRRRAALACRSLCWSPAFRRRETNHPPEGGTPTDGNNVEPEKLARGAFAAGLRRAVFPLG